MVNGADGVASVAARAGAQGPIALQMPAAPTDAIAQRLLNGRWARVMAVNSLLLLVFGRNRAASERSEYLHAVLSEDPARDQPLPLQRRCATSVASVRLPRCGRWPTHCSCAC